MTQKPSWLHEKQISLPNGEEALWSYDTESDFLVTIVCARIFPIYLESIIGHSFK